MTTTTTKEIPREQWAAFSDAFSLEHEGWLATLEVIGPEVGAQVEAQTLPFAGLAADTKDGERAVSVTMGASPEDHVTHTVAAPTHVRLEQSETERGTLETLQIESADGMSVLLRFEAAVPPENGEEIC